MATIKSEIFAPIYNVNTTRHHKTPDIDPNEIFPTFIALLWPEAPRSDRQPCMGGEGHKTVPRIQDIERKVPVRLDISVIRISPEPLFNNFT